ncbi:MAG: aliphatic sulfonate ABC transporter substrate-binding protein [Parcubacteria group bacterium LiPW_41]|nr:MAG: aliphatic sulfonate ABC transporter substrate-binding protein [Parcubacteria group bacterium LiPW_41]
MYIGLVVFAFIAFVGLYYFQKTRVIEVKNIQTITIGTSYWPGQYWIDIADTKGWFSEAGVSINAVNTQEDYYKSIDDLLSGKLDLQVLALSDVLEMNSKGANFVMILPTDVSLDGEGLVVQPEIKTIGMLKGKKIGVESGEVFSEMFLDVALNRGGLTRDDIEIVLVSPERANGLFLANEIDAIITWDPYLSELMNNDGKVLFTVRDAGGSISGLVGRKDFIDSHIDEIKKIVGTWKRATEFIASNKTETYAIISGQYKFPIGVTEKMSARDYILSVEDNKRIMSDSTFVYSIPKAIEMLKSYIDKESGGGSLDITQIIDEQFIKGL